MPFAAQLVTPEYLRLTTSSLSRLQEMDTRPSQIRMQKHRLLSLICIIMYKRACISFEPVNHITLYSILYTPHITVACSTSVDEMLIKGKIESNASWSIGSKKKKEVPPEYNEMGIYHSRVSRRKKRTTTDSNTSRPPRRLWFVNQPPNVEPTRARAFKRPARPSRARWRRRRG